ncbi:olfactory receptor 1G1-like [Lissotriton helveticus]
MEKSNTTSVREFILFGFSDLGDNQKFLFFILLIAYILTLFGNIVITSLISTDSRLHTPMYYLLCCLSVVDLCFTSTTIPKLLFDLLHEAKTITFLGCFTQMFFFHSLACMENILMALMAYDRYVAVCRPLHYTMVMSTKVCFLLVSISYVIACLHSLLYTVWTSMFTYCGSHLIQHFFCEIAPLWNLSCSDIALINLIGLVEACSMLLVPFLCIFISYGHIVNTILKIKTAEAKRKTFSTCSSHIMVVMLFYASTASIYIRPDTHTSILHYRIASIMYIFLTPLLNPFIYSFRNKDVKGALRRALDRQTN